MIQTYKLALSRKDFDILNENSKFFIHFDLAEHKSYYALELRWQKLPLNFHTVCNTLESLWIISQISESNDRFTPKSIIVRWLYQERLELLKKILYPINEITNKALLNKLSKKIEKEYLDIDSIIQELEITDYKIHFQDSEIFVHAINILYPEKIIELKKIVFEEDLNTQLEEQKKPVKYVMVRKNWIYNDKNEIIFDFTANESRIANELKSKWMNLNSLKVITKQPSTNAVSFTIKKIQQKIKKYKLGTYLELSYSRSEKVYHLKVLKH